MIACGQSIPPPQTKIVIATGTGSGAIYSVGTALSAIYARQIPGLTADVKRSRGLEVNADDLQRETVDLAFIDSETTYVAYRRGTTAQPEPHTKIRAIAVLFPTVVHVFARQGSGVHQVADLRGKRIMVGPRGSDTELAAALILESHGLSYQTVDAIFTARLDAADEMRRGTLDAAVYYLPFRHQAVVDLTTQADVHLVPIAHDQIASIQERTQRSRFLKSVVVPGGTYRGQDSDVLTVGEDILLLCREALPEALIYDVTRLLFESVPQLAEAHPAALDIDAERGPTTSIPLHPGAARYYRERELPK